MDVYHQCQLSDNYGFIAKVSILPFLFHIMLFIYLFIYLFIWNHVQSRVCAITVKQFHLDLNILKLSKQKITEKKNTLINTSPLQINQMHQIKLYLNHVAGFHLGG